MSRRANSPKLELKLNLSPPRRVNNNQLAIGSPNTSVSSTSDMTVESSCMSSETDDLSTTTMRYGGSPEEASMMLVGCPRCLMYVMLSEGNTKCPRCKSTVLLDFLKEENTKRSRN